MTKKRVLKLHTVGFYVFKSRVGLSIEKIRQLLMKVQTSILFDKQKRIRYGLPSRMKRDARKIYNILDIKRSITPYIIEKCKL